MVSNPGPAGLFTIDYSVIVCVHFVEDSLKLLASFLEMSPGSIVVNIGKSESVACLSVVDS